MEDQTETYHGEPDAVILLDPAAAEKVAESEATPSERGGPLTLSNSQSAATLPQGQTQGQRGTNEVAATVDESSTTASKKKKKRIRYRRNKRERSANKNQGFEMAAFELEATWALPTPTTTATTNGEEEDGDADESETQSQEIDQDQDSGVEGTPPIVEVRVEVVPMMEQVQAPVDPLAWLDEPDPPAYPWKANGAKLGGVQKTQGLQDWNISKDTGSKIEPQAASLAPTPAFSEKYNDFATLGGTPILISSVDSIKPGGFSQESDSEVMDPCVKLCTEKDSEPQQQENDQGPCLTPTMVEVEVEQVDEGVNLINLASTESVESDSPKLEESEEMAPQRQEQDQEPTLTSPILEVEVDAGIGLKPIKSDSKQGDDSDKLRWEQEMEELGFSTPPPIPEVEVDTKLCLEEEEKEALKSQLEEHDQNQNPTHISPIVEVVVEVDAEIGLKSVKSDSEQNVKLLVEEESKELEVLEPQLQEHDQNPVPIVEVDVEMDVVDAGLGLMPTESDSEQIGCCVKLRRGRSKRIHKFPQFPPPKPKTSTPPISFKQRSASLKQRISSVFSKEAPPPPPPTSEPEPTPNNN